MRVLGVYPVVPMGFRCGAVVSSVSRAFSVAFTNISSVSRMYIP